MRRRVWFAAGLLAVFSSWGYFFPKAPQIGPLARLEHPTAGQVVIFAPHSDDEVLATGGLIQQKVDEGQPPKVVLLTAGDGYKVGAETHYRRPVSEALMLAYGRHRLGESRSGLNRLGLPSTQFIFLGFPDGVTHRLWLECWRSAQPCSGATGARGVPYGEAYAPGAPYSGEELIKEIKDVLRASQPSVVVYPHPNEAHVDHWALSNFVTAALEEMRRTEPGWSAPDEWLYLVHRGDWPAPKGYHPTGTLLPPAKLARGMTTWRTRGLTPDQVQRKAEALSDYKTQVLLMRRYLHSFVRANELFGTIERAYLPAFGGTSPFPAVADSPPWRGPTWMRVITDPQADTLARGVERGADARGVWAAVEGNTLYFATEMVSRPKRPVEIHFYARGFQSIRGWGDLAAVALVPDGVRRVEAWPGKTGQERIVADFSGNWVRVGLPLDVFGDPDSMMVNVETRVEGVLIDRTAWRPLSLDGR